MKSILRYLYSIILFFFFCVEVFATEKIKEQPIQKQKVFQGIYLSADAYAPVASFFNGGIFGEEASLDVNLWNRLFPVWEVGMMDMDQSFDDCKYTSSGYYNRLGINYNFIKNQKGADNMFYIGLRYASSTLDYKLYDVAIGNNYWNENAVFDIEKKSVHVGWGEFLVGIRAEMLTDFYMGFSVRYKALLHFYNNQLTSPSYIPGYGANNESNWGCTYTVTYKLPF